MKGTIEQGGSALIFTPNDAQPVAISGVESVEIDESTPREISPETTRYGDVNGVDFPLSDGRMWALATPQRRVKPRFVPVPKGPGVRRGAVTCELETRWDYPGDVSRAVKALLEAIAKGDLIGLDLIVDAAARLVMLCHEITFEEAAGLFELSALEVEDLAVGMLRMFRGDRPASATEEPEIPSKDD